MATRGYNPGIGVPNPGEASPAVITAIQQIISKLGALSSPTFEDISLGGFVDDGAGFVKNDATGLLTGGNVIDVSDLPAHAATHESGGVDEIDHDSLLGFVADEHVAHSGVTLTAGNGLTGGGDISASRSFAVDGVLEDLMTLGAPTADGEFIVATGAGVFAYETGDTARTSLGVGTGDTPAFSGVTLTGNSTSSGRLDIDFSTTLSNQKALDTVLTVDTSGGDVGVGVGVRSMVEVSGGNDITSNILAHQATAKHDGTGTVALARALQGQVQCLSGGTVTEGAAIYANGPYITSGAVTTMYGIYIEDMSVTGVTNAWGLYQAAADDNYLAGQLGVGISSPVAMLHVAADDTQDLAILQEASDTDWTDAILKFRRSRGTVASPTVVQDGDEIGTILWRAYDGSDWESAAAIWAEVDGEPATAGDTTDMPGKLVFATTADGTDSLVTRMVIDNAGVTYIGDGGTTDYTKIEVDGTVEFNGAAKVWDDLRVPISSTKLGGSKDPDFAQFKDDGSSSQGVFIYWFDKTTEEEVYFTAQFPHAKQNASDIECHVHWVPKTTGASGEFVKWGLEYTWVDIDGTYGNTTIIYSDPTSAANATTSGDAAMTASKHYVTELGTISGSGITGVSSMLIGRVFRDAGDGDDDYDDDAGLLEIDFHYEIDTLGSRSEYTK